MVIFFRAGWPKDHYRKSALLLLMLLVSTVSFAQVKGNDVTAPLHAMQPAYPFPYHAPETREVRLVLDKVYHYLDSVTPARFIHKDSRQAVPAANADTNTIVAPGDYRLTSYEWGVTYSGMLQASEATGDAKFAAYTRERVKFITDAIPYFQKIYTRFPLRSNPLRQPLDPKALDDAGAVSAAMIKLQRLDGNNPVVRKQIDHYMDFVSNKEFRLADGTLARNRPLPNTLWLDDLYMGVPALAQMGALTGDKKYFDDAVKQVQQFSARMFNKDLGIYMHGWVQGMQDHPEFHWARANGWALMAMTELLDVLPATHPGYKAVEDQLKAHIRGLVKYQSGDGLWHQLLDRTDSYLETSATAIYTYCIARAINKGRIDAQAYSPTCILAWNAITTKVNPVGQVEGTCVGTGMAFDPAFYYYRPVSIYAAHSYGPVLLAGSELINLLKQYEFDINDSAIQVKAKK